MIKKLTKNQFFSTFTSEPSSTQESITQEPITQEPIPQELTSEKGGDIENRQSPINSRALEEAYLTLITTIITYLKLKGNNEKFIEIQFDIDDLTKMTDNFIPLPIKKFCSNVRIAPNSPFGRNLLEILLLPISRNVIINNNAIQLTRNNSLNHVSYRELMLDNSVREACIKYIDQLPELEKSIVTSKTTLRSFKRNSVVQKLCLQLGNNTITPQGKYILVGLFLDSILFEIVSNTESKHSKAIIPNFIIDCISKSGI